MKKRSIILGLVGAAGLAAAGVAALRVLGLGPDWLRTAGCDDCDSWDPDDPCDEMVDAVAGMLMSELEDRTIDGVVEVAHKAAACRHEAARDVIRRSEFGADGDMVVKKSVMDDVLDKMASGWYSDSHDVVAAPAEVPVETDGAGVGISREEADSLMPEEMTGDYIDFGDD